jgi:hypothetical protein
MEIKASPMRLGLNVGRKAWLAILTNGSAATGCREAEPIDPLPVAGFTPTEGPLSRLSAERLGNSVWREAKPRFNESDVQRANPAVAFYRRFIDHPRCRRA